MISGPATLRTSREREVGYSRAMEAAGAKPVIVRGDFTIKGATEATARLMAGNSPTAMFLASDTMALGALTELRRLGVRVPGDVSVAGFDDIPGLEFIHPTLTTVRVPMAALGAAGVARLLQQLDDDDTSTRTHFHPVELVVRESTGKPREEIRHGL
jgi:LacI family transcriptional regulator